MMVSIVHASCFSMTSAAKSAHSTPIRVLVVEDDQSIRETLGMVLESFDYGVSLVDGGETALSQLKQEWPDVMLLDLTLEGMTGEELYDRIRTQFGHTPPTVVLSAVPHGENRTKHMEGVQFLAKPYSLEDLNEMIERVSRAQAA